MGNRYAVADLHGQLHLFNQIKEYINDDDIVYALGDFGDRGDEPWRTLKAVLDDPQFIYLMGNHDLMLLQAIEEYEILLKKDGYCNIAHQILSRNGAIAQLGYSGGYYTIHQWKDEPNRMKYYEKLKRLPVEIRLAALDGRRLIYLTHAGYTPKHMCAKNLEEFLWDRHHFLEHWGQSNRDILIHGHTPIPHLINKLKKDTYNTDKIYCLYSNGHKIDIDIASYHTNLAILLNIDTLESMVFKGDS